MGNSLSAELELADFLQKAGLSGDAEKILNKQYLFECEHGSHKEILVGKIQAIEWSDEGGLQIYVTNPKFFGRPLISLVCVNGEWGALIDVYPGSDFYPGKLHFVL